MITSLRLVNFKNFADETLHLGPFTLIVGANASGKSNVRDAFRFLHGTSRDYTLAEILGGKYGADWEPIRGAANEIIRFGQNQFTLEVKVKPSRLLRSEVKSLTYIIRIQRDDTYDGRFRVAAERLTADPRTVDSLVSGLLFTSDCPPSCDKGPEVQDFQLRLYLPGADKPIEVASNQPGLSQLPISLHRSLATKESEFDGAEWTDDLLAEMKANSGWTELVMELLRMRFLELAPGQLREPSLPGATQLGDSGSNLSPVLEEIYKDPERRQILLSWLHELTPMDVSELKFPLDHSGRVHLRIQESNGRNLSAYSASDGTLRFLGILAALLSEENACLYFFEEIDSGIHPARLHLLLELIERQTAKGKIQVVATTHSPDVLNLISDTTFENTSVIYRDEHSADAVIRRVAELSNARELRKSQGLGRLHAGGWMENILSFAEADMEDPKGGE